MAFHWAQAVSCCPEQRPHRATRSPVWQLLLKVTQCRCVGLLLPLRWWRWPVVWTGAQRWSGGLTRGNASWVGLSLQALPGSLFLQLPGLPPCRLGLYCSRGPQGDPPSQAGSKALCTSLFASSKWPRGVEGGGQPSDACFPSPALLPCCLPSWKPVRLNTNAYYMYVQYLEA